MKISARARQIFKFENTTKLYFSAKEYQPFQNILPDAHDMLCAKNFLGWNLDMCALAFEIFEVFTISLDFYHVSKIFHKMKKTRFFILLIDIWAWRASYNKCTSKFFDQNFRILLGCNRAKYIWLIPNNHWEPPQFQRADTIRYYLRFRVSKEVYKFKYGYIYLLKNLSIKINLRLFLMLNLQMYNHSVASEILTKQLGNMTWYT